MAISWKKLCWSQPIDGGPCAAAVAADVGGMMACDAAAAGDAAGKAAAGTGRASGSCWFPSSHPGGTSNGIPGTAGFMNAGHTPVATTSATDGQMASSGMNWQQ